MTRAIRDPATVSSARMIVQSSVRSRRRRARL